MMGNLHMNFHHLNEHLMEIIRGATTAFVLKIIAAGLAFALNILLARHLGSEGVGIYFLALAIITFGSTLGKFGTDILAMREIARQAAKGDWSMIPVLHRQCLRILLTAALPVALLTALLSDTIAADLFGKPQLAEPLLWMSLGIIPLAMFNLYAHSLKGLKRIKAAVSVQSVWLPALAVPGVLILTPAFGVVGAVWAHVGAALLTTAIAILFWKGALHEAPVSGGQSLPPALLSSARPLLVIALLTLAIKWSSTFFLGLWGTASDVGVFNIAQRTALLTSFILIAVNSISAPKFAELHQRGDMQALEATAVGAARLMTLLALPVLAVFLLFPDWVLRLFGAEFAEGGTILSILALGQFVNVATGSVGYLLMMTGHEKLMRNNIIFCVAINLVLNLILVPRYGIMGAAVATSVTMASQNLVAAILVWRHLGIVTLPFTARMGKRESQG